MGADERSLKPKLSCLETPDEGTFQALSYRLLGVCGSCLHKLRKYVRTGRGPRQGSSLHDW